MKIVNGHLAESIAAQGLLKAPNAFGYVHLAAEIEAPHPWKAPGRAKQALIDELQGRKAEIESWAGVRSMSLFNALVIPPGSREGRKILVERGYRTHVARFDLVLLLECASPEDARKVAESPGFLEVERKVRELATYTHRIVARNPKRIDEVKRDTDGVFLFNYFFAADPKDQPGQGVRTLLDVWEYTAGWWTSKANLTNSTPLQPLEGTSSQYQLINHCRWDRLIDVVPHLIFRRSLSRFVLANFTANDIVAMPILYRLAKKRSGRPRPPADCASGSS